MIIANTKRLTILHSNDLHGDFLAENVDQKLLGSGSVRSTELGPIVLLADLSECFPYDDAVHLLRISGAQLKRMILFMMRDEVWTGSHCEFYQFSEGMRVVYDCASRTFKEFSLYDVPIEDTQIYKVGMQHFHFKNIESFFSIPLEEIAQNGEPKVIASSCLDILDEYLANHANVDHYVCGRLIVE